mmetsp:Transcript_86008/g.174581  ORF Transcript_86008/g.174581 Transcript_86008/m.174581 type:complete len:80 (-) Transcript_86008:195-434(-)
MIDQDTSFLVTFKFLLMEIGVSIRFIDDKHSIGGNEHRLPPSLRRRTGLCCTGTYQNQGSTEKIPSRSLLCNFHRTGRV